MRVSMNKGRVCLLEREKDGRSKREGAGGAGEGDHVRRVSRLLPARQAATLQPLLLLDVHREDGGSLWRRAVRLPKETSLPAGGVAGLQPAFFVERIKDLHCKMARAEGKVEALCEQCAGEKSVAFCRQCAEFICGDCVAIHKKIRVFAGHVVASLEDLKKGGVKNIPLKEAPTRKCVEHDKTLKLFCFDCERLICRDCIVIEHKEHKFEFVKKCAPEGRRRLRESLAPLQEVRADMAGAEKRVVSEEAKVERQREEVCGAIQQSFEQLKAVLERRKAELVGKVCSLAQEKKNALAIQKTVLQVAQKEIQLLTELVERNVESTSDQDLMSIRRQLQRSKRNTIDSCHWSQQPLQTLPATFPLLTTFPEILALWLFN